MKIIIIIPAYNEEENILRVCKELEEKNIEYVVINDGSKDNTARILDENNLNHIDLVQNLGIGGAVQTGYKYALENNYDIALQFDGDGQHDANYVEKVCKEIENNKCNICIGSRYLDDTTSGFKSTFMRRLGKNIISILIKMFWGVKITDPTSGFRAVDRKVIEIFAEDYPTDYPEPESIVTILKHNLKVLEIPVNMKERTGGKSFVNPWTSIKYMVKVSLAIIIDSVRLKSNKGGEK